MPRSTRRVAGMVDVISHTNRGLPIVRATCSLCGEYMETNREGAERRCRDWAMDHAGKRHEVN